MILSATSLVIALVLAELALWSFMPFPHPYAIADTPDQRVYDEVRRAPRNRYVPSHHTQVLHMNPDPMILRGVSPKVKFSVNRFGFRNTRMESVRKPSNEIRIFAVGASATECLYLDDADAWPEILHRKLSLEIPAVNVVNAGYSGDTTRDHIALLTQRIVPFQPDVVLLLIGANDIGLQLEPDYSPIRSDYRSRIPEQTPDGLLLVKSRLSDISQVARLVVLARRGRIEKDGRGNPVQDMHGTWLREAREHLQRMPLRVVDPESVPKPEFEENLRTLVGATRYAGAEPVLLTHPAIWGAPPGDWEKLLWIPHPNGRIAPAQLGRMLENFNDVTRRVASELNVPLVDLARVIPQTTAMFYDDNHFTVAGAERAAEEIARVFASNARLRDRIRKSS